MTGKKQFPLRMDALMYEALERWAADEFRSVNAHIEYVLREALRREGRLPGQTGTPSARESGEGETDAPDGP